MLDADEDATQEHRHGLVVGVHIGQFDGPADAAKAGVVEHHIEPAPLFDGLANGGFHLLLLADIGAVIGRRGARSSASCEPRSSWISAMTTRAPCSTKRRTVPSPMPLAPPVMIATLPSSCPMRSPRMRFVPLRTVYREVPSSEARAGDGTRRTPRDAKSAESNWKMGALSTAGTPISKEGSPQERSASLASLGVLASRPPLRLCYVQPRRCM